MSARVLVVGAGPVGLIVASELTKYGIDVDIIDREQASTTRSKALSVSAASLKAFHGLGLSDVFLRRGKLIEDVYVYYGGRRCAHINNRYLDTCYRGYLSISQPETEQILTEHLVSQGTRIRRGIELTAIRNLPDRVDVTLRDHTFKRETPGSYDFVIGCDGAQSSVRQLLEIPFVGKDYDMHFIMGDVRFDTAKDFSSTSYHVADDGFMIFLPMAQGLTRLVIKKEGPLAPDRAPPQVDELQAFLDRHYPETLTIQSVEWASSARFFSRIARENALGRVFLAGDAYHLFSPIGGQGMNTGIQDAINLAWKLALYANGKAKRRLIDTYPEERYSVVTKVLNSTHINTEIISRTGDHPDKEILYHPRMSNRQLYRAILPTEFSGLHADHSTEASSTVGRHVPFFNITDRKLNIEDSYDIPKLKRNIGFVKNSASTSHIASRMRDYEVSLCPLEPSDIETAKLLQLTSDNDVCMVRPDGYISYKGPLDDLPQYLAEFYA
jgi:2-polyprenyl-6-methoxyphenol hydroxylase-like FAD-dependent oxidoreductase